MQNPLRGRVSTTVSRLSNRTDLGHICKLGALLLLVVFTVTVRADCPPRERGWFVRICPHPNPTESGNIGFDVGLGGLSSSHRFWRDWHAGESQEFDLPIDLLHAKEIWIKSWTNDEDKNVSICYFFNDHVTEVHKHDHEEEDETSRGDHEDGDCECR